VFLEQDIFVCGRHWTGRKVYWLYGENFCTK